MVLLRLVGSIASVRDMEGLVLFGQVQGSKKNLQIIAVAFCMGVMAKKTEAKRTPE
jgi:hypothetical protein